LKQLGLALQTYESAARLFPPGDVSKFDSRGNDTGPGWGWAALLLPQFDQKPLYDSINFTRSIEAVANPTSRLIRTKVAADGAVIAVE
jgi:hypothetical protein